RNLGELWLPPPTAPEAVPPGVFPGERGVALNESPTRIGVYDFASTLPDILFDFTGGSMLSGSTLTRASTGWYFGNTGTLQSAASNAPRFDYNIAGVALRGLLVEPTSMNGVRNSSASGAVIGTPGTAPTNWSVGGIAGLSRAIVALPVVNGIQCVDIRYFGTTNSTAGYPLIFENNVVIGAAQGQTWTESVYCAVVGGTLTNINSIQFDMVQYGAGSDFVGGNFRNLLTPTLQRFAFTGTLPLAGLTAVQPRIIFSHPNGVAIDVTLRFGLPQMERQSSTTSPMVGTTSQITRAADVLTLIPGAETYDITVTRESGATTIPAAAAGAGGYVVPTDPSPVQQVLFQPTGIRGFDLGAVTLVTMTAIVEAYATRLGRTMNLWVPLASATPLAMG